MGDIILITILGLIWIFIFAVFKTLRTEIIFSSLFGSLLIPGLSLATSPIFPLKEIIFIFFLSGLSATIFHAIIGISYDNYKINRNNDTWFLSFLGFIIAFSWLTVGSIAILELSATTSMLISGLLISLYIWIKKKNLLLDSLISGALMSTLVFFSSFISYTISGQNSTFTFVETSRSILGIPEELIVLSLILGLFIGPLYEFTRKIPLKHGK